MRKLPFYHLFGAQGQRRRPSTLAERLVKLAPVPMSKVFFANSGSEANDTAVKLVWYYNNALGRPQRRRSSRGSRAYHGVTIACGQPDRPAASATATSTCRSPQVLHTDCPHYYRYAQAGRERGGVRHAPGREPRAADPSAKGPDTVAAFIAEPVMGAGGVIVPPATYFEKIQAVLKKHDVLLIADEVICGFGRTGNMFGTQTFGMQPDIMTMAKALSSGYLPISAAVISEEIYRALRRPEREDRHLRPRLHLLRPSGRRARWRWRRSKIYEERDIARPRPRAWRRSCQDGAAQLGRATRWSARCAASG